MAEVHTIERCVERNLDRNYDPIMWDSQTAIRALRLPVINSKMALEYLNGKREEIRALEKYGRTETGQWTNGDFDRGIRRISSFWQDF